jgi:hypothetical protein
LISASRLLLRSKTDSATTRVLVSSINGPSFEVLDINYVGNERSIFKYLEHSAAIPATMTRRQASCGFRASAGDARATEGEPAFRNAWTRGQRCLVVTDGFYEWKKLDAKGKLKQPHAIAMAGDSQMVMAGLWAKWKSPTSGEEVLSCTILTCEPNSAMAELHDRMPVILAENDWPKWLGEEPASEQELLALLKPCPDEDLKIWPVDKMVGNVKNNGPQLILPVLSNSVPA